jgi:hypothetical protein
MRTQEEVALVLELFRAGRNDCEIARETGIPRGTVRQWRKGQTPVFDRTRAIDDAPRPGCEVCCGDPLTLPQAAYTYISSDSTWAMDASVPTRAASTGSASSAPTDIPGCFGSASWLWHGYWRIR